jgi:hypothetical protein
MFNAQGREKQQKCAKDQKIAQLLVKGKIYYRYLPYHLVNLLTFNFHSQTFPNVPIRAILSPFVPKRAQTGK